MASDHHCTVLLEPAVDALLPVQAGGAQAVYVDGTFGRGGHSRLLLSRLPQTARLVVFDKDPVAVAHARQLQAADPRVSVVHAGFGAMQAHIHAMGLVCVQGILLDLGVSSPQIEVAQRGFSFLRDGPLDMRMDTTQGLTAAQWLAQASLEDIKGVIAHYGEERFAFPIAKAIVAGRASGVIDTTGALAQLVARVVRTREKGQHPATRTFQAIRIHINQELEELQGGLAAALSLLAPAGRLAVISFHSLEDRLVKQTIAAAARPAVALARLPIPEKDLPAPLLRNLGRVLPAQAEIQRNPRARSAVLRVAQRTQTPLPSDAGRSCVPQLLPATRRARGQA